MLVFPVKHIKPKSKIQVIWDKNVKKVRLFFVAFACGSLNPAKVALLTSVGFFIFKIYL